VGTFFSKDPYYSSVVSALTTRNNRMEPYTVRPDAETIMEKRAEEEAGFMQQKFVAKNTRKLAPIISAKGSMADAKVLHANGHGGSISGTMYVSFQDGSKFIVDNSIVIGASKYGLRFYRYPTTFHDVYLANGERMPQPSEEKMHKIFAGIDTPVEPDEETPVENVPVGESFRRMLQLI
jgi:hypothetical protein